jgi:hypothetical protein
MYRLWGEDKEKPRGIGKTFCRAKKSGLFFIWPKASISRNPDDKPSRCFAERERFELSVELYTLRRFSKPLVSAAHPPLHD